MVASHHVLKVCEKKDNSNLINICAVHIYVCRYILSLSLSFKDILF